MRWRIRKCTLVFGGLCLTWAVLPLIFGERYIIINTSPSMPPGFYIRCNDSLKVGSIVDFKMPESARGYIRQRTRKECDNWYLLKPIIAGPGDFVDTTCDRVIINGHTVANMPPKVDIAGNCLPRWCEARILRLDEFFVLSDRIPNSFDSRCFGPIKRIQIEAVRTNMLRSQ